MKTDETRTRPTPAKLKRRPKAKLPQYLDNRQVSMFDGEGYALFHFETDAILVAEHPALYGVGGMQIELKPTPRDPKTAMEMTLGAVTLFHFGRSHWRSLRPKAIEPMLLESWLWKVCTVSVRSKDDDLVIHATYSRPDNLEVSLPHMLLWKSAGLGWLCKDHECCARNFNNPTPWLGRTCGCP